MGGWKRIPGYIKINHQVTINMTKNMDLDTTNGPMEEDT
jgi:hypothetical protein